MENKVTDNEITDEMLVTEIIKVFPDKASSLMGCLSDPFLRLSCLLATKTQLEEIIKNSDDVERGKESKSLLQVIINELIEENDDEEYL